MTYNLPKDVVLKNTFLELVNVSDQCEHDYNTPHRCNRRLSTCPPSTCPPTVQPVENLNFFPGESTPEVTPLASLNLQSPQFGTESSETFTSSAGMIQQTVAVPVFPVLMPFAMEGPPLLSCGYTEQELTQIPWQFASNYHQVDESSMRRARKTKASIVHEKNQGKTPEMDPVLVQQRVAAAALARSRKEVLDVYTHASTDASTSADSDCKSDCTFADSEEVRTTIMLRNLPNNYTRDMLAKLFDERGFAGQYDFLYLPMDFGSNASLGYAFINLISASIAQCFWKSFADFSGWAIPTKKHCKVSWSDPVQGLAANLDRYRNSPVMHNTVPDSYKPVLFKNGVRVPFPSPTKKIKVPRMRIFSVSSRNANGEGNW